MTARDPWSFLDWESTSEGVRRETARCGGVVLRAGSRVRLRPRAGADIFDVALAGRVATVESIEQDYEDNIHVAVVVDDDPGRDLGALRQPGHRFFFALDEVQPLDGGDAGAGA